jgi:hypothetical protein
MTEPDADTAGAAREYRFRFDPRFRRLDGMLGISDDTAVAAVDGTHLRVRFGPWRVRTPLANVVDAAVTGPYRLWRTIGPARLGLSDRGLTFATNPDRGVLLTFAEPVKGIDGRGWIRHPNLTVTVADVDGFAANVRGRSGGRHAAT